MKNQAYKLLSSFKTDEYDFDFYDFLDDFNKYLITQIFNYFETESNPIVEIIEDISFDDFSKDLSESILFWSYYNEPSLIEQVFCTQLLRIADNTFQDFISSKIPIEIIQNPDVFLGRDTQNDNEVNLNSYFNEKEIEKIIDAQNRFAIEYFKDFSFQNQENIDFICDWKISEMLRVPKPKIFKNSSIITLNNKLDPSIYKLINSNPKFLETMDWRIFEELLADILERFGYDVELTSMTKDGGIDIIAIKQNEYFGNDKYLLQAKRYTDKVQVSPVRELLFLTDHYKVTKSCLATTSTFTNGAWELANQYKWRLELKDKFGILDWIKKLKLV